MKGNTVVFFKKRSIIKSHFKSYTTKGAFIMGFKSDIEIAQECEMKPITEIAAKAGIADKYT